MDLEQALTQIDAAVERSSQKMGANEETLQALRFLWRHNDKPDFRDALTWFKDSLDGSNYIGRFQNANASRNRIRFLLGRRPK